jgi:hypothetical protein
VEEEFEKLEGECGIIKSYKGPEQCSLAWVFMGTFFLFALDSNTRICETLYTRATEL